MMCTVCVNHKRTKTKWSLVEFIYTIWLTCNYEFKILSHDVNPNILSVQNISSLFTFTEQTKLCLDCCETWSSLIYLHEMSSNIFELDQTRLNKIKQGWTWLNLIEYNWTWMDMNKLDKIWLNLIKNDWMASYIMIEQDHT